MKQQLRQARVDFICASGFFVRRETCGGFFDSLAAADSKQETEIHRIEFIGWHRIPQGRIMVVRNLFEFAIIAGVWISSLQLLKFDVSPVILITFLLVISLAKTAFFGAENIRQLAEATRSNMPYHRFMLLMLVNMVQIILSFGLDFHCLQMVRPDSFSVVLKSPTQFEMVFEFLYVSTLNFTFFGYGDVTPQTVPAKFITMTEIVLAFVTV